MWELLAALFGGAAIALRVASDKTSQKHATQRFENEQQKLRLFRESVTNNRAVNAVNDYMSTDGSHGRVEHELRELFMLIPELKGREHCWLYSNHRPPASNWSFVELILCASRGCIPVTKQFEFTINPYYIGNSVSGAPRYVSLSDESCEILARWIERRLQAHGTHISLNYLVSGGINKFVWSVDPREDDDIKEQG